MASASQLTTMPTEQLIAAFRWELRLANRTLARLIAALPPNNDGSPVRGRPFGVGLEVELRRAA